VRARRRQQRVERDAHLRRLLREGSSLKGAARAVGVDVKTVRRLVRGPQERRRRASKLDPFRPLITQRVCEDGWTAVLVLEEIRALGYTGGASVLKAFVRTLRPQAVRRPHLRFETGPGEQGQVDLSPYEVLLGGTPTPVVCFSFVLGFSRWQYVHFVRHADVHAVCYGHVLAFEAAGGVPAEILYDRMKQVVLESHRHTVVLHPLFAALATHYGFRVVPLAPGYKEGKGKVENPFRYVEGNFLLAHRREGFRDLADLNDKALAWLRSTAWVRCHGTTQEQPAERLAREQGQLAPLPPHPFAAAQVELRLVGDDFCVAWATNRYSVPPAFVGHTATVRVLDGTLTVVIGGQVVAAHPLRETRHQRYLLPEHEAAFRQHSTSRHVLGEQFLRLGPAAREFQEGLVAAHGGAAGYHMARILTLAERVGAPRVAEALRHALRYGAFEAPAVARIVAGKTDQPLGGPAPPGPLPQHLPEYLRGVGEHQRPLRDYQRLLDQLGEEAARGE
jgi:transposase